jgi:phosphatidylinositol alpha-1,6-mannosyltransferase
MKYLLFTLEYPPFNGGVGNYYKNIIENWPEEVKVLCQKQEDKNQTQNISYKKLILSYIYPKWLLSFWHLGREINKNKIKHVLVGQILPLGTVSYFLSKIMNFEYSVFLHGTDLSFAFRKKRKAKLSLKILKKSKYIICTNSYVASKLKDILKNKYHDKIYVVNPGIKKDIPKINQKLRDDLIEKHNLANKFIILTLGRLVERKGVDKVIKSINLISKETNNFSYIVAGDGPYRKKIEQIKSKLNPDLREKVILLGKVEEDEKWALIDICDLFVMVSKNIKGDYEGFGIVYLEANLLAKPVVAGNSGGEEDSVNKESGVKVDPFSEKEIADAIIKLIKDEELRIKMGKNAQKRVINDFNWEKQSKKLFNILEK